MKFNKSIYLFICLVFGLVAIISLYKNITKKVDGEIAFSDITEQIFINALDTATVRYTAMLKQIDKKQL